jgi:mannonate dehydratase
MPFQFSRREMLELGAAAALTPALLTGQESGSAVKWPPELGPGTPKICLGGVRSDEAAMRQMKQIGVDYVLMGGPRTPWTEEGLRELMQRYKAGGLSVINLMIGGMNDIIHGGTNRDGQIEYFIQSIRAAGKVGLPVIEYNFYAHRLIEGYKEELGRGGAGYTAYDYEKSRTLPPLQNIGVHNRGEQLRRAEYFLKAVIPEADKANVIRTIRPCRSVADRNSSWQLSSSGSSTWTWSRVRTTA